MIDAKPVEQRGTSRVLRIYSSAAVILVNSLVLFVLVNLVLAAVFFVRDLGSRSTAQNTAPATSDSAFNPDGSPVDNGKRTPGQLEWFDFNAYEGIKPEYASAVLDDFYELSKLGFIHQPWVDFSEPFFESALVNIDRDERGFPNRRTINPPNDSKLPVVRILALGGSTTFGYGVSDEHTWPSYLSRILNERARSDGLAVHIEVVNYGRGYYNSSQETVLLTQLLKSGHRPHWVVFMDGLNWIYPYEATHFTDVIEKSFKEIQFGSNASGWERLSWIPVVRLATAIQRRIVRAPAGAEVVNETDFAPPYSLIANRFEQNRKIAIKTCEIYSVKPLFVIQPNAINNYPVELYRLPLPEAFLTRRRQTQVLYPMLRAQQGTMFLGDLFEAWGKKRKAIVDDVHYSPSFNEFLAQHVAVGIDLKGVLPRPVIDESAATGLIPN
jgi:hypothetical protein